MVNRQESLRLVAIAAVGLLCWCVGAKHAAAQRLTTAQRLIGPRLDPVNLPIAGGKVLGFRATIEVERNMSVGNSLVETTITPQGTVAADRKLVIRFDSTGGQVPPRNGMIVDVPITLAQGSGRQTFRHYLPKWSAGRGMIISVLEDGRVLPDYEAQLGGPIIGRRSLSAALPSEIQIDWLYVVAEANGPDPLLALPRQIGGLAIETNDLLTDWRIYQRFDVIVFNQDSLEKVANDQARLDAIRHWALHGGTLVVLEAEDDEKVFDIANFTYQITDESRTLVQQTLTEGLYQQSAMRLPVSEQVLSQMADRMADDVALGQVGAGQLIVIRADSPLADMMQIQLVAQLTGFRASAFLRRGVDPLLGSSRSFEWMIPGVAQPPVYTFMGLLTGFVILVGPVAYRRTTKVGRSYLMFAIAPLLALVTTVAMFGYGILSDGFGTVVRARQLTWVDGASGDAGERVRATYFAGIRPADGLRFDAEAEVLPFLEASGISWEESQRLSPATLGRVVLREDEQRYDSSFLPSRQQKQFVTHAPRRQIGHVSVEQDSSSGPSQSTVIKNDFEFVLHEIVIRDASGDYWTAESIQPGSGASAVQVPAADVSKTLGRIYDDHRPMSEVRERNLRRRNSSETFDVISTINRAVDRSVTVRDGIFEDWLERKLKLAGEIPPGYFVATSDVTSDVLAVDDVEMSASVRYVFGTLR